MDRKVTSVLLDIVVYYQLSQPKLNQQLSSTEFEVRLHSYRVIHPTPHKLFVLLLLLLTAQLSVNGLYS